MGDRPPSKYLHLHRTKKTEERGGEIMLRAEFKHGIPKFKRSLHCAASVTKRR
jgi:hypothetical protein